MTTAELVMPRIDLRPRCYFCRKIVGEGQFCYVCENYVCDSCDWTSPVGRHRVEKHQELDEDD